MRWDAETDVVVVGAGACGLAASLTLAQEGCDVVLLEKGRRIGGNTAISTAMIPAAASRQQREVGIRDSPEQMASDILAKAGPGADRDHVLELCRRSAELVDWLVDAGVPLGLVTDFLYTGQSVPRFHAPPSRQGKDLADPLGAAVAATGRVTVVTSAPVHRLIVDDAGAVVGVEAGLAHERIGARSVVLAACGFGGNPEMVRTYCPEIADALYFGERTVTGDAIRWGMALGAETRCMDAYQGHGTVAIPHGILLSWAAVEKGGCLVNAQGMRFANEDLGYSAFGALVMRQADGLAFVIFDGRIDAEMTSHDQNYRELDALAGIRRAGSLVELADRLGLPGAALARTVEALNAGLQGGRDPLGRSPGQRRPLEAPYCGVKVTGALFHTQGGLAIDTAGRVLRPGGRPVVNLFAGGGSAVGISGHGAAGYSPGNGLLTALGWGRIAGLTAARQLRREA
ncbi:MAG: FAD-dependent oxidoreductase [Armatimonadota bacterium]|nr:FAD-dependent oxidoreductase [Armatimonadota bacterium]